MVKLLVLSSTDDAFARPVTCSVHPKVSEKTWQNPLVKNLCQKRKRIYNGSCNVR